MKTNLDKLNKQYLINADLYNALKYMTIDFMADTKDINPECVERKMEIDELINDIDRTKQDYELVRDHANSVVLSSEDEQFKIEFNRYQKVNFMGYYKEFNGDMDLIEREMYQDFKQMFEQKNI